MPVCKRCSRPHYNFHPCSAGLVEEARRNHAKLMAEANLTPAVTPREGWRPWRQEPLDNVRLQGGMQVVRSGLKQAPEGWKER